jgi:hypothetical protein
MKMTKTLIDYDLNIYCPELLDEGASHYDPRYWKISFRDYGTLTDLDISFQLSLKFIKAIGLEQLAETGSYEGFPELETWMDKGLDCWLDLDSFIKLYAEKMDHSMLLEIIKLPKYQEERDN